MVHKVVIKEVGLLGVVGSCAVVVERNELLLEFDVNLGGSEGDKGDGECEECIQNFSRCSCSHGT